MKVVFVGEAPSATSDPERAFSGRSGRRIASLVDRREFSELPFDAVNIFRERPARWDADQARREAWAHSSLAHDYDVVVLVGYRVAAAFSMKRTPLFEWTRHLVDDDPARELFRWAIFPHPSGRNRFWNDSEQVDQAREFVFALSVSKTVAELDDLVPAEPVSLRETGAGEPRAARS
jgi:uracil-DNA glycosylase